MSAGEFRDESLEVPPADHYATLGLDRGCTTAQVRAAYRALAKRHHPDRHAGDAAAGRHLQALNAAHEMLSDPARRRAYDRERAEPAGEAAPRRTGRIAKNVAQDAQLRIEDFFRGTRLEIVVRDPAHPEGREQYELVVPPGSAPGARFRVARDEPFTGGFVNVRLKALPGFRFKARGSDLRADLKISAARAADGGVELLTGPAGSMLRVTIPARVGRHEVIRLAGEGLPKPRGGRGDLLVRITYRPQVTIRREP